jgi:hypothetical protein
MAPLVQKTGVILVLIVSGFFRFGEQVAEEAKKKEAPVRNVHIVDFSVATGGPLHITLSDGRDIAIEPERGRFGNLIQKAFSDVQLAEDGRHIGWLADYMICEQSYPCHAELVIYQPGNKLDYIPPQHGVIWDWKFVDGGKQVLVHSGFPHGDDTGTWTLYDTETGRGHGKSLLPSKEASK